MPLSESLTEKLEEVVVRFREVEKSLADPEVLASQERYQKTAKEHSDLSALVEAFEKHQELEAQLAENRELLEEDDEELAELARAEIEDAEEKLPELERRMSLLLVPKNPNDDKNVILEIRAGTGGDEAALFAGDLLRIVHALCRGKKLEDRDDGRPRNPGRGLQGGGGHDNRPGGLQPAEV